MKKIIALVSFLCIAALGWSQTSGISFDTTTYNYGKILKGSSGECKFTFTNTSTTPLILTNVKAACGCTTPNWPREAINPKETGEILVKYNTNTVGYFTKTISVYSNKQEGPVVLTIMGQVVESLE